MDSLSLSDLRVLPGIVDNHSFCFHKKTSIACSEYMSSVYVHRLYKGLVPLWGRQIPCEHHCPRILSFRYNSWLAGTKNVACVLIGK